MLFVFKNRALPILFVIISMAGCTTQAIQPHRTATSVDMSYGIYSPVLEKNGEWGISLEDYLLLPPSPMLRETEITAVSSQGKITSLDLTGRKLSKNVMARITEIQSLRSLCLAGTTVTDEDLALLASKKGLLHLNLAGTCVTDQDFQSFAQDSTLQSLCLNNTTISDSSIQSLIDITTLKSLSVIDTKITTKGIQRFKKARPNVKVMHTREEWRAAGGGGII